MGFADEGMADADVGPEVQQLLTQLLILSPSLAACMALQVPIRHAIGLARRVGHRSIGLQQPLVIPLSAGCVVTVSLRHFGLTISPNVMFLMF